MVYAGWPTPLAQAFEEAGGRVVSGFEMLLHQAARQVELMTGRPAPVAAMRAAGLAAMGRPVSLTVPDAAVPLWLVLGLALAGGVVGLLVAGQLADGRYRHLDERGRPCRGTGPGSRSRPRWPGAR